MRDPASEKREIIALVERTHLPVRRTLDKLGIPSTTFYRWCDRYRSFRMDGLEDRCSGPGRVWNRIMADANRRDDLMAVARAVRRLETEDVEKWVARSGPLPAEGAERQRQHLHRPRALPYRRASCEG